MGAFDNEQAQIQPSGNLRFAKLAEVGDGFAGEVTEAKMIVHPFNDEKRIPTIKVKTSEGQVVSYDAVNVDAERKIIQANPSVGDHLAIELVAVEPFKGKTIKKFKVTVTPKTAKSDPWGNSGAAF